MKKILSLALAALIPASGSPISVARAQNTAPPTWNDRPEAAGHWYEIRTEGSLKHLSSNQGPLVCRAADCGELYTLKNQRSNSSTPSLLEYDAERTCYRLVTETTLRYSLHDVAGNLARKGLLGKGVFSPTRPDSKFYVEGNCTKDSERLKASRMPAPGMSGMVWIHPPSASGSAAAPAPKSTAKGGKKQSSSEKTPPTTLVPPEEIDPFSIHIQPEAQMPNLIASPLRLAQDDPALAPAFDKIGLKDRTERATAEYLLRNQDPALKEWLKKKGFTDEKDLRLAFIKAVQSNKNLKDLEKQTKNSIKAALDNIKDNAQASDNLLRWLLRFKALPTQAVSDYYCKGVPSPIAITEQPSQGASPLGQAKTLEKTSSEASTQQDLEKGHQKAEVTTPTPPSPESASCTAFANALKIWDSQNNPTAMASNNFSFNQPPPDPDKNKDKDCPTGVSCQKDHNDKGLDQIKKDAIGGLFGMTAFGLIGLAAFGPVGMVWGAVIGAAITAYAVHQSLK